MGDRKFKTIIKHGLPVCNCENGDCPGCEGYADEVRATCLADIKLAIAEREDAARVRDAALDAIDAEPEFPGDLRDVHPEMAAALENALRENDLDLLVHAMRVAVRLTKAGIRERFLAASPRRPVAVEWTTLGAGDPVSVHVATRCGDVVAVVFDQDHDCLAITAGGCTKFGPHATKMREWAEHQLCSGENQTDGR
jgi:hypothetical protein